MTEERGMTMTLTWNGTVGMTAALNAVELEEGVREKQIGEVTVLEDREASGKEDRGRMKTWNPDLDQDQEIFREPTLLTKVATLSWDWIRVGNCSKVRENFHPIQKILTKMKSAPVLEMTMRTSPRISLTLGTPMRTSSIRRSLTLGREESCETLTPGQHPDCL